MIVLEQSDLLNFVSNFMLISVRLSAMFLIAPFFSAATISIPIRILVTVSIAILMISVIDTPSLDPFSVRGILLLIQEALIGATIGFVMQLAFAATTSSPSVPP